MSHTDSTQFRLHVLGTPDLRAPDGRRVASVLSQPKRLGLLTYLALAPAPVSRATLVALFWPESDEARARNALSQAVFYLRRSLDERIVQSVEGDRLWAPPEHLWCDARERLAGNGSALGELLEGWNADDSQALQEWLDTHRRGLQERVGEGGASAPATYPAPAPPPAPGPAEEPAATHRQPAYARFAGLTSLAVLILVALAIALANDPPTPGGAGSVEDIAVLMPRVTAGPGAPEVDASTVHAELLASLPHVDALRIIPAAYAGSLQDLRRQFAVLGTQPADEPGWILGVDVRVTADRARVIGLLYRSPAFDLPGRVSFDVTYGGAEAALLEAPREIARGVSRMVEEVLALP